jgi:hypothetical protein
MAEITLPDGYTVLIDDADYVWAAMRSWRLWRKGQSERWIVVTDEAAKGRRYRVRLHREVAIRMHPELRPKLHRVIVKPRNGNHLDVRRENLEVVVRASQGDDGRADPRPAGYRYSGSSKWGRKPFAMGRSKSWLGGRNAPVR